MRSMNPEIKYAAAIYDVAVDGGTTAAGAITPAISSKIPDNAIIVSIVVDTLTTFVGAGNTLRVSGGGQALIASMTIANRSLTVPYTTLATTAKASGDTFITVTNGTANATAGKCVIIVGYFTPVE